MNKYSYAFLYLALFMGCMQVHEELEIPDIIPLDSIDQLTSEAIKQMYNNKAQALDVIDSLADQYIITTAQMAQIKQRIANRQILINDTTITRIHYRDTTITRITYENIIVKDTIRITDTIRLIDTLVTKQKRQRKKRNK